MKQNRSFTDYIFNRFYDEIFYKTNTFFIQNRSTLALSSNVVRNINYVKLENISIVNVLVDDLPDQKLSFDVTVDAEIVIYDTIRTMIIKMISLINGLLSHAQEI